MQGHLPVAVYLAKELYRIMIPGRNFCIHCMDIPARKGKDGYIGVKDFSGTLIRLMQRAGFAYFDRITIQKNPEFESQRTRNQKLQHAGLKKDRSNSGTETPDYILVFKKLGESLDPIKTEFGMDRYIPFAQFKGMPDDFPKKIYGNEKLFRREYVDTGSGESIGKLRDPREAYSIEVFQRYAQSVWNDFISINEEKLISNWYRDNKGFWNDIKQTKVLRGVNFDSIKDSQDEKHICPLQLQTIARLIQYYSNPNDVVYDPYGGIGSTGYEAILANRKVIMHELKPGYFNQMVKNCNDAYIESANTLFDYVT